MRAAVERSGGGGNAGMSTSGRQCIICNLQLPARSSTARHKCPSRPQARASADGHSSRRSPSARALVAPRCAQSAASCRRARQRGSSNKRAAAAAAGGAAGATFGACASLCASPPPHARGASCAGDSSSSSRDLGQRGCGPCPAHRGGSGSGGRRRLQLPARSRLHMCFLVPVLPCNSLLCLAGTVGTWRQRP